MPNRRLNLSNKKKQNAVDFMIEFEALAIKANTDELYTIFLLKKNV